MLDQCCQRREGKDGFFLMLHVKATCSMDECDVKNFAVRIQRNAVTGSRVLPLTDKEGAVEKARLRQAAPGLVCRHFAVVPGLRFVDSIQFQYQRRFEGLGLARHGMQQDCVLEASTKKKT